MKVLISRVKSIIRVRVSGCAFFKFHDAFIFRLSQLVIRLHVKRPNERTALYHLVLIWFAVSKTEAMKRCSVMDPLDSAGVCRKMVPSFLGPKLGDLSCVLL